jgi:DNA-directed RNA polymerase specialized sigma24 family protein
MAHSGSVTGWLNQLEGGDPAAMDRLWERFFLRLQGLAHKKLPAPLRRLGSAEDVALDAFASFWRGVERGRFPELAGRDSLWRLLVVITARKVYHLVRDDGRKVKAGSSDWALEQTLDREPEPEFAAQAADECQRLMTKLADVTLASVAQWRMDGYTTAEIASRLQCSPRTVERKLLLIQGLWAEEIVS